MAAIYGTFGKLAIGGTRIEFVSCGVKMRESIENYAGVQAHRGELATRNRLGNVSPGGPLECVPTPAEWVVLLPYILGGTPAGTSYPLGETLPTFTMDLDDGTSIKAYSGCTITTATISAQSGGPVKLSCQIEAIDEGVGSTVSGSIDQTYGPFMFYEGAFSVGATSSVTPFDFSVTIDNVVDTGRFLNSRTRTSLKARGRHVNFATRIPWGDFYSSLYGIQGSEVAVVGTFTSAGYSLAFTMPKVRFPREGVERQREDELVLPLNGIARKTNASTDELQVVLDSTP